MAYIGKSPQNGVRNRFVYAATQGQTAFTGADADSKTLAISDALYTDVYQNGVKLKLTTDWTATTTTVTLVNAASVDDVIEIISFTTFGIPDTVSASSGGTFNGAISATSYGAVSGTTGTFSSDLTVDTSTLKVDSSNNKVGIGLTSPQELLHLKDGDIAVGNGTASNNSVVGRIGFSTDSSNSRFIGMESFRGSDAANADLRFHTYGGDSDKGERMRIANDGNVAIGSTNNGVGGTIDLSVGSTSSSGGITLWSPTSGTHSLGFGDGYSGTDRYRGYVEYAHADDSMRLATGATERMRITSAGKMGFGTSTQILNGGGALASFTFGGAQGVFISTVSQSGGECMGFVHQGSSVVGTIAITSSATSYNTSSDYRLKENVNYTWDATTRLKQLKPAQFNWIADDTNTLVDGFLAHEVSSVVPQAITKTKDAMTAEVLYEEGDELPEGKSVGDVKQESVPDYQGIDQSKLVPLLVKALQEQQTVIESLTTRITALESA